MLSLVAKWLAYHVGVILYQMSVSCTLLSLSLSLSLCASGPGARFFSLTWASAVLLLFGSSLSLIFMRPSWGSSRKSAQVMHRLNRTYEQFFTALGFFFFYTNTARLELQSDCKWIFFKFVCQYSHFFQPVFEQFNNLKVLLCSIAIGTGNWNISAEASVCRFFFNVCIIRSEENKKYTILESRQALFLSYSSCFLSLFFRSRCAWNRYNIYPRWSIREREQYFFFIFAFRYTRPSEQFNYRHFIPTVYERFVMSRDRYAFFQLLRFGWRLRFVTGHSRTFLSLFLLGAFVHLLILRTPMTKFVIKVLHAVDNIASVYCL